MDLTTEEARMIWKIMRDISIKELSRIYDKLNVVMPVEAYRGESFYGGAEQPDGVSMGHNDLPCVVADLFSAIFKKEPFCRQEQVVWTKGNGVPSYWFSEPCGCFRSTETFKQRGREYKGILHDDGSRGLGVPYTIACNMWGKDIVDSLPEV